jgi:hypothetical protein
MAGEGSPGARPGCGMSDGVLPHPPLLSLTCVFTHGGVRIAVFPLEKLQTRG